MVNIKRGRPAIGVRKYETGESDPNSLSTPADMGRLAAKNSRTIVKIMQLLDVKSHPATESLDRSNHIASKLERLKSRLNRRLKKCANWSDERMATRLPYPDKKKKLESSYKKAWNDQQWQTHPAGHGSVATVMLSSGSEFSYTADHNAQLLEKGEILTRVAVSKTTAAKPVQGDPTLYRGRVDTWVYLTDEETRTLERDNPEELKRRRRLDNDHRYYMKRKAEGR